MYIMPLYFFNFKFKICNGIIYYLRSTCVPRKNKYKWVEQKIIPSFSYSGVFSGVKKSYFRRDQKLSTP